MSSPQNRMAVTVIGGYLGSGKTTLLNHLLRNAQERIAVLVNDFGDINVDLDLIESRTDDAIELSNGCICCSMVDGFSEALDRIVDMDPRPERLVIETSGVADPATVAAYGHGPGLALDAVIVMVDVETIRMAVNDRYVGQTVALQLTSAEILIANKADLVEPLELEATLGWLRERCPNAAVLTAVNSQVGTEVLFGRAPARDAAVKLAAAPDAPHHHPEHTFDTWAINPGEPQSRDQIAALMDELDDSVVRAKGLVNLVDEENPFVLQRVGARWSLRRSPNPWPAKPGTHIVVIAVAR